jgi:hypothetical protein
MIKKQKTQRNGERAPGLSAGYAESIITPGGKGGNPSVSNQYLTDESPVHDDLWVRALAIKSNRTACKVIISCDLMGLDYQSCQQVRTLVNDEVPRAEIILACSTNSHGPDMFGIEKFEYLNWLIDLIAQTALRALALLTPVVFRSVSFGMSELETGSFKLVDHQANVQVLQLADRLLYTPIAILVRMDNFPRTILPPGKNISADFPGILFSALRKAGCGPLVFLPGVQSALTQIEDRKSDLSETGAASDQFALFIKEKINPSEWQVDPQLVFASAWFDYEMDENANETKTLHSRVTLIRIGDLCLAALPLECSSKLAQSLTKQLLERGARSAGVICQVDDALELSTLKSNDIGRNISFYDQLELLVLEKLNTLSEMNIP